MGLDYIRARTGKPWRKRWDRGLDRLKAPTLLDLKMSEASRVVTVQLNSGLCLESGGNWFWRLSERVESCGGQAARSRVSSAIS